MCLGFFDTRFGGPLVLTVFDSGVVIMGSKGWRKAELLSAASVLVLK
jgi:serine kinase of HPr protein (carbohydrate metabolism regulator)